MSRMWARLGRSPRPDWSRSTHGTVISSTVQVPSRVPLVLYTYCVGETTFRGNRVNDEARRRGRRGRDAESTVARYPAGASVVVYYDPDNPSESILEP